MGGGRLCLWDILERTGLATGRWSLGLSKEPVEGPNVEFRNVSPKIRSAILMSVTLTGS
jgi:hypothetical protein